MYKYLLAISGALLLAACKPSDEAPVRSFRMGFANSAPRPQDVNVVLQSLNMWTTRADAAIIHTEVPWDSVLAGKSMKQYVVRNYKGLADYYRTLNFALWVAVDPANGLDRTADAPGLVSHGKSIAQPEMQELYKKFVVTMDSVLRPDHLGLAIETNLIRLLSPAPIYQGVVQASASAATAVRSRHPEVKLWISVQAEEAWGKLNGTNAFKGVAQDFADFPFAQELGISSYPYFNYTSPKDLPSDYYSRLVSGRGIPVFVSEGGWTSRSMTGFSGAPIESSPAVQGEYIEWQASLLGQANAVAVFQLTFTDLDPAAIPTGVNPSINYFISLGLVDKDLKARESLAAWDLTFTRKLTQ